MIVLASFLRDVAFWNLVRATWDDRERYVMSIALRGDWDVDPQTTLSGLPYNLAQAGHTAAGRAPIPRVSGRPYNDCKGPLTPGVRLPSLLRELDFSARPVMLTQADLN